MKIIQILQPIQDKGLPGRILGLGDNGITYEESGSGEWREWLPNVAQPDNAGKHDWIIWQNACDAMRAEMLKELRDLHKENAVVTHAEVDELLCEVHHPYATGVG